MTYGPADLANLVCLTASFFKNCSSPKLPQGNGISACHTIFCPIISFVFYIGAESASNVVSPRYTGTRFWYTDTHIIVSGVLIPTRVLQQV